MGKVAFHMTRDLMWMGNNVDLGKFSQVRILWMDNKTLLSLKYIGISKHLYMFILYFQGYQRQSVPYYSHYMSRDRLYNKSTGSHMQSTRCQHPGSLDEHVPYNRHKSLAVSGNGQTGVLSSATEHLSLYDSVHIYVANTISYPKCCWLVLRAAFCNSLALGRCGGNLK